MHEAAETTAAYNTGIPIQGTICLLCYTAVIAPVDMHGGPVGQYKTGMLSDACTIIIISYKTLAHDPPPIMF